jgi:diguanylate cyclase (GGDEF)-like protein/PAS domain S-box-containing protein
MGEQKRSAADFYAALSRTNGAILRARERDPLLWEICRICVEHGAAKLAYIALVDDGTARPIAWAGPGEEFLDGLHIPLDPSLPEGRGPIATAIRTGEHYISNDLFADPVTVPWRERAARLGSHATAAFPIRRAGSVIGALSLHTGTRHFFDGGVVQLLDEMARDLSFALDNLDREGAWTRAMQDAKRGFERFQKIFHATPVATVISRLADSRLLAVNDAYCALMGRAREELVGRTAQEIGAWPNPQGRADIVARLHAEHRVRDCEVRLRAAAGEVRDIAMSAEVIDFEGQECMLAILNDITERQHYESRIRFLATHDGLTDLPNRTLMLDRTTQAIQHARRTRSRMAVLFVDLDRFKVLNEALGQRGADDVLIECAARLKRDVRDGDTVARFSGDEFVVLAPDLDKLSDCYALVQRLLASLSAPMPVGTSTLHVRSSMGVSVFPADGDSAEQLLRNAEAAMRRAKRITPGGAQFYTLEMSAELQRLAQLEAQLHGALSARQLRLVYQPKVELATGSIAGVEALLRWRHPKLGDVPPSTFIPVAEEADTIVTIGEWVLRTACAQNMAWQAAGLPALPVSVNVSARQFVQPDLVSTVATALDASGMPGHLLELEITETAMASNADRVIDILSLLRELDVRFSVDDFGTGYSNLGYLKRFHLDRLKIDQSFVRNVDRDPGDAAIARAVISLARSLQLEVTAEGVENAEQCDFMKRNTCDEIQGFYFSRPVEADVLARMLREGRRLH